MAFLYGVPASLVSAAASAVPSMAAHTVVQKIESELFVIAENNDGTPGAIAMANANQRIVTSTLTGYITGSTPTAGGSVTFQALTGTVKNVSDSRKKGEFAEVDVEIECFQTLGQ